MVNYASSSINKLKASLNDDTRVFIYDRHMFIVQATGEALGLILRKGCLRKNTLAYLRFEDVRKRRSLIALIPDFRSHREL